MANRYVRAAGGNSNAAGTWESTPGGGETVAVPTAADEVYLAAGSGQLTINAAMVCRRFDCSNYANTITHGAYTLTIGDSTAPTGRVAMVLAGTYTPNAASSVILNSSGAGVHTLDTGGKTIRSMEITSPGSYRFITNNVTISANFILTNGAIDFNGLAISVSTLQSTGSNTRVFTLGTSLISILYNGSSCINFTGSGLSFSPNTAIFLIATANPGLTIIDGLDLNGTSIKFTTAAGTATLSNTFTCQDFIINPDTTKTIAVASGKTVTINGTMYCRPKAGLVTFTGGTFSKASGVVNLYQIINTSCTFSGGATWNACNNSTLTVVQGLTLAGGINYINPTSGDDTLFVAYGMYKVAYTGATGTCPVVDEVATGATSGSTAKVSWVDPYEWAEGAGTIYFKSKTASFATDNATQIDLATGGGHFHIGAADFVNAAWLTMNLGATAARIAPKNINRIAKSPVPTSIGDGLWTDQPATLPVTLTSCTASNSSGLILITKTAHGFSNGDCVYIEDMATALTANGCWVITYVNSSTFTLNGSTYVADGTAGKITLVNRAVVKLTTAQTTDVCKCQKIWNIANTSTITLDTSVYKDGDASHKLVKASPGNSTLYSWMATLSSLNLSGKQKLSFWIRNETAILANQWSVCLCSGADGTGVQNTFKIPAIPSTARWLPLTLSAEEGVNLYNGIQSIAIYSGSAAATTTGIYFNNFIACATSGLNLQSLISHNTLEQSSISATGYANEGWYGIKNISEDGKVIFLDSDTNSLANANIVGRGMGYSGATNTYTTYIRETHKTALVASSTTVIQECMKNGTSGNNIEYQGGFSLTNGLQEGESFFDGLCGWGYGLQLSSRSYNSLNRLNFCRYYQGIYTLSCNYLTFTNISNVTNCNNVGAYISNTNNCIFIVLGNFNNNGSAGIQIDTSYNNAFTNIVNINNNNSNGLYVNLAALNYIATIGNVNNNSTSYGIYFLASTNNKIDSISNINCNNTVGVYFKNSSGNIIKYGNSTNNVTSCFASSNGGINYLMNFLANQSTEYTNPSVALYDGSYIFSQNHDQVTWDVWIFTYGGTINNRASTLSAGSGKEWLFTTSQVVRDVNYPIKLMLFPVYVNAGAVVTVHVLFKKGHASNIGAKLVIEADAITGVTQQVQTVPDLDTEQNISVTCNPTYAGVIEVWAWVYYVAGHSTVIVDSPGATLVTQA